MPIQQSSFGMRLRMTTQRKVQKAPTEFALNEHSTPRQPVANARTILLFPQNRVGDWRGARRLSKTLLTARAFIPGSWGLRQHEPEKAVGRSSSPGQKRSSQRGQRCELSIGYSVVGTRGAKSQQTATRQRLACRPWSPHRGNLQRSNRSSKPSAFRGRDVRHHLQDRDHSDLCDDWLA